MSPTATGAREFAQRRWRVSMLAALAWTLAAAPWAGAGQEVASFAIVGRPAKDMLPVVRKFLEPGGAAEAHDDKLIVRTGSSNMQEIRDIIGQLDRKPRVLRIRVRSPGAARTRSTSLQVGTTRGAVVLNPGQKTSLRGSETFSQSIGTQDLVVEEGQDGFIHTPDGGFYVRPVVHGEKVRLDVLAHDPAVGSGRVESGTRIVAPIGKWTSVSGAGSSRRERSSGIGRSSSRRAEGDQGIQLQVTEVKN